MHGKIRKDEAQILTEIRQPLLRRDRQGNTNSIQTDHEHLMNVLANVLKAIINENGKASGGEINLNVINQNNSFKQEEDLYNSKEGNQSLTLISNIDSIQKSKYGEKYRQSLDPRDQMLTHPFQFILQVPSFTSKKQNKISEFMKTQAYQRLCSDIQEYIVDVVENVISVSFNLLIEGKLKEKESKDYASKNLLLNIHSLFKEIMKTFTEQEIFNTQQNKKLRYTLCELIDNTLSQSLTNLTSYYPQAPPTGGTPRMREALLSIDRNYNQQLDFLYTQNLKLRRQDDGNYTEYIMKVVNRAIEVTGEIDPKDPLQQTLFEKFVAFSENLFWVAQQDSYNTIIHNLGYNFITGKDLGTNPEQHFDAHTPKPMHEKLISQDINSQSGDTNLNKKKPDEIISQPHQKQQYRNTYNQKHMILGFMQKPIFSEFSEAQLISDANKQKTLEEMKKRHDFQIGQKIPSSVQPFSKKDIRDKNFSTKNSQLLRILTKWAQNLENIFDNPQIYTTNRVYPFKTLNHEIIYPKKELKQLLYNQIANQRLKKQKIKEYLITRNKVFQGSFLAKDNSQDISKFIKRYTDTRVLSSKMNTLLIQFMKEYVSSLINLLVEAGRASLIIKEGQYSIVKQYSINLIVFKIGDLMRSKIYCNEASFIRLLKTLYILEEMIDKEKNNPLIQLVRIKNKLDTKDNNILINYLFMGKIQCQLQMSVQKMSNKQFHYYNFNHFLYELTRGKFGILAECASIICQNDPIVSSSSSKVSYEPKRIAIIKKNIKDLQSALLIKTTSEGGMQRSNLIQTKKETIKSSPQQKQQQKVNYKSFVCRECSNLKLQENMDFIQRNYQKQICNQCLIDKTPIKIQGLCQIQDQYQYKDERLLKDENMAKWIIKSLKNLQIQKLMNYKELQQYQQSKCLIFSINPKKNKLQFSLFNSQPSQNIFFTSEITKDLWERGELIEEKIQYQDITLKIKQSIKFPKYTYIVSINQYKACQDVLKRINFLKQEQIVQKLDDLDVKCQQMILKEQIINNLRNKSQSLVFNSNNKKMEIINELVQENMDISKYKWIQKNLRHIQFIFAQSMKIEKLPYWLMMCQKIQLLNLSDNSIKNISIIQGNITIKELILKGNQIQQIDWRKLINLQKLNVSHNNLQKFTMKNLPQSLLEIDLSDNKLQKISLQTLPLSLRKVEVSRNQLKTVLFKNPPLSLQYLDLSYNKLQNIECCKLQILKFFFLNSNNITCFKIRDMLKLQYFSISDNKLKKFSIKNCPLLKQLHIGRTCITQLEISDFPALAVLSIHENSLLNWIQILELPMIRFINMNSIIPSIFDHFRIEKISQQTVFIRGNAKIMQFLYRKFPKIKFSKEDEQNESFSHFEEIDEQSGGQN